MCGLVPLPDPFTLRCSRRNNAGVLRCAQDDNEERLHPEVTGLSKQISLGEDKKGHLRQSEEIRSS